MSTHGTRGIASLLAGLLSKRGMDRHVSVSICESPEDGSLIVRTNLCMASAKSIPLRALRSTRNPGKLASDVADDIAKNYARAFEDRADHIRKSMRWYADGDPRALK